MSDMNILTEKYKINTIDLPTVEIKNNISDKLTKEEAINVLKTITDLIMQNGVNPPSIKEKGEIHHSNADKAVECLILSIFDNCEKRFESIQIKPSKYNCEKVSLKKARELLEKEEDQEKRDIRELRRELRNSRQGAARSIFGPGRCRDDGWPFATIQYDYNESVSYGLSIPDPSKTARLFDIHYYDNAEECTTFTVFLDKNDLINKYPKETESIFPSIDNNNSAILHLFNTHYTDITLRADDIAMSGYGYVVVSPAYTWRDNGPNTPEENKKHWYHCYQPEDLRAVDSPHGNLQDLCEMIWVLSAYGIDVIVDIPLNFMGTGGEAGSGGDDAKGTLQYPSKDILLERERKIKTHPGVIESQQIIRKIGEHEQSLLQPYLSEYDFEPSRNGVADWENLVDIRNNRLGDLPKLQPNSWVIEGQRGFLQALKTIGVKGFRIDAEKHLKPEHFNQVFTPDIIDGLTIFGETITTGYDSSWTHYLESRLVTSKNIGAYDFPLQNSMVTAFQIEGDLRKLTFADGNTPTAVPPTQSIAFSVNHDIPNNGKAFEHMLFSHPIDEMLANAYILALPERKVLIFSDGGESKSVRSIKYEDGRTVGGQAWIDGWNSPHQVMMNKFHNLYNKKHGILFVTSGEFYTKTCIAFSRGEEGKEHTALVIINKAAESVIDILPCKLSEGVYIDLLGEVGNKIFISKDTDISLQVRGRSVLMLVKDDGVPGGFADYSEGVNI